MFRARVRVSFLVKKVDGNLTLDVKKIPGKFGRICTYGFKCIENIWLSHV